jgi:hypothetical protein
MFVDHFFLKWFFFDLHYNNLSAGLHGVFRKTHSIWNDYKLITHPTELEMRSIMRKTFILIGTALIALIFVTFNSAPTQFSTFAHAQPETPSYAKWGMLAMKETQSKYPNSNIIDYLHEGSESKGDATIEKFKLWLKEGDKEFGVFVRIEYTTETEKVVNIEFEETSR